MLSYEKAKASADFILNKIKIVPKIAIILGSGLSDYHQKLDEKLKYLIVRFDFPELPQLGINLSWCL